MRRLLFALWLFNLSFISPSYACFTVIVGKEAAANRKILIARNSDSKDATRAKNLNIYQIDGIKSYIGLPYSDLAFDPSYDMAQVASNRFGVSISATETIQSNPVSLKLDPPSGTGKGVSEPNIPAIVMPTARSAEEAIRILGQAIETRGVNDSWGFGVLIADSHEAWYLETLSGHQWVAIRIPDDVYFVAANGPGQIQEYQPEKYTYLMSNYQEQSPIEFAKRHYMASYEKGWFDFRETFADVHRMTNRESNYIRIAYAQHQFNPHSRSFNQSVLNEGKYPMFLKPEHPITVEEVEAIQESHYVDYPDFDPYRWSYQETSSQPFYYPIANPRTSNAHVTEVGEPLNGEDVAISNVEYIALGMPGLSFYLPVYYGISQIPSRLTGADKHADDQSLFWQFRKIQTLVFLHDEAKQIPYAFTSRQIMVNEAYRKLRAEVKEKQAVLEQIYSVTLDAALIDQFTQEIVDKIAEVNQQLISNLMTQLNIDAQYGLKSNQERNAWFTQNLRKQDCFYRRVRCDASVPMSLGTRRDKYVDGAVDM